MSLKRRYGYTKVIICAMRIFAVLVLVSILIAGEAGAQTACEKFKNISALNGRINFLYNNVGNHIHNTPSGDPQTVYEWNFQEYVDESFRLNSSNINFPNYYWSTGPSTGLASVNDWLKITHYKNGKYFWDRTATMEGSAGNTGGYVYINLTK